MKSKYLLVTKGCAWVLECENNKEILKNIKILKKARYKQVNLYEKKQIIWIKDLTK